MNKVNKELRNKAVSLGLCDTWQKKWVKDKTPQQLIDMYKKGIDFCLESNYPDNKFIKENFTKDILSKNNMFVDEDFYVLNPENDCVILGESQGKLIFDGYAVRDIYINGNADVEIEASDFAKIFVNVYDDAQVVVTQKKNSVIHVYKHGTGEILSVGNVTINRKYND
jgi:hypothetical protein